MCKHLYAVGQRIAYAEQHHSRVVWNYDDEVISFLPRSGSEPRYLIRCAELLFDRVVKERELRSVQGCDAR